MNDGSSGNGDSGVVALVMDGILVNGSEMRSTVTYGGMACTLEEERKLEGWWRINLFLFKIIEYGVSWLRKVSEIPTGH